MSYFLLADYCFKIEGLFINNSSWFRFKVFQQSQVDLCISVCSKASDNYKISVSHDPCIYITVPNNILPYLIDKKIYELCVETLIRNRVIHLHSSFILYQGQAILFTGPSGIGKTTQAELWQHYQGAEIINGDVSLIRKCNNQYYAYGAPVHGSSPYCENKSAPIKAVVALQQAKENHVEILNSYESLCYCLPEVYRPIMSDETYDILWETVDDFFSQIPVYRLTCRPDRNSTDLLKEALAI